ncbi:MAG: dihydroneopterin aldolase [Rhodospirillales bacterium]|nr:dihydroneopterin aldolase [Rhodospirillales bacterium]
MTTPRRRNRDAAQPSAQKMVVRDMTLNCAIGITKDERARPQRLRINLEAEVAPERPSEDRIAEVVHYGHLAQKLRDVCAGTEAQLLETLAGEIAEACFGEARIKSIRLRIEKLDRYADTGGIGIEVEYRRGGKQAPAGCS